MGAELHGNAHRTGGGAVSPSSFGNTVLDDTGAAAIGALLAGDRRPRLPPLRPCAATLARGFVGVRPGSQIAPASMRRGGLLAARAALVAVARVLVVALAWVPPGGGPGPCPGPGLPPSVGRALRCLSWRWRAALRRGGGVLLAPLRPWAGATPSPWRLRRRGCYMLGWRCSWTQDVAAGSPPAPCPPPPSGGRGKAWDNGKEDSYERNPGGVLKPGCASAQSCGNWSQTWKTWWKTARKWQET